MVFPEVCTFVDMMVSPQESGRHVVAHTVEVHTSEGTSEHGLRAHYLGETLCRVEVETGKATSSLDLTTGELTHSTEAGEETHAPVTLPAFHRDTINQRSAALEAHVAYTGRVTQLTYVLAQMAGTPNSSDYK